MPATFEFFPCELELKMPFLVLLMCISSGFPTPCIPDDNCTTTVLAFRDRAFEVRIFKRMVLHMHGQSLFARNKAWTSRHRPTFQHAIHLKAKIIMQSASIMFLHDKELAFCARRLTARLVSQGKIAFPAIGFE